MWDRIQESRNLDQELDLASDFSSGFTVDTMLGNFPGCFRVMCLFLKPNGVRWDQLWPNQCVRKLTDLAK